MPEATPYRMSNKARTAAKSLAIAYAAYQATAEAPEGPAKYNSILVWGRSLIEAQSRVGVELHPREHIEYRMLAARTDLGNVDPATVERESMRRSIANARHATENRIPVA